MATPRPAYGRHLYQALPEVYRERDRKQPQPARLHLQKYLDAHGVLLDNLRRALDQLYADRFADVPEDGRVCQSWVIPYLADLVGAVPVSPFANGQRGEVANAVRWNKAKGTLATVADIVETVAQTEAELQEGWQRVAHTARPGDPIPSATSLGAAKTHPIDDVLANGDKSAPSDTVNPQITAHHDVLANEDKTAPFDTVNPQIAARHPGQPPGTIDLTKVSRAVQAPPGASAVNQSRFGGRNSVWPQDDNAPAVPSPAATGWRQLNLNGAPCFPDSYEDRSPRLVDVRTPSRTGSAGRYHPKALIIHLPPPYGLCPPDPAPVAWPGADAWTDHPVLERVETEDGGGRMTIVRNKTAQSVAIAEDLTVGPDGDIPLQAGARLRLEKLRIDGRLSLTAGNLELRRCAVRELAFVDTAETMAENRQLSARGVLFDRLTGDGGHATLEYCTVLAAVESDATIFASEVIFPDALPADRLFRVRYSRLPTDALTVIGEARRAFNTDAHPWFLETTFGSPGAGVLQPATSLAILEGAEDGTEMGAFHDWRYAAQRQALIRKLENFLPMGIHPVIVWDQRLLCVPPELAGTEE